jgi:hypothetical protein
MIMPMPLALAKYLNKKGGAKPGMKPDTKKGGKAPAKGSGKR